MSNKRDFFLEIYPKEVVKFGNFVLKSGIESPFYVDLRALASDPIILKKLSCFLLDLLQNSTYDLLCGVPYAALPIATAMSLESGTPLIIKRKEAKTYGTKKIIEGVFQKGQNCVLVEDVITSGKSLIETIDEVEKEGLKITDIVVIMDRQQGGKELLENKGYKVHCLFSIFEVTDILLEKQLLNLADVEKIHHFIKHPPTIPIIKRLTYQEKLESCKHPFAKKLLKIAIKKQSNLIASADITHTKDLLKFANEVGPHIVALKTHIDILNDFSHNESILALQKLAEKHEFLLFEDRKFADIGHTQALQFTAGVHQISHWADMITAHVISGQKSLDCFLNVGVVAIISLSSKGALTDSDYQNKALQLIENQACIMGGVSQTKLPQHFLQFTPGVNLSQTEDLMGQQYHTPDFVFKNNHTDFAIVGRGIYKAENPQQSAKKYQTECWKAYIESL